MSRVTYVYRNIDGGGVEVFEKGTQPEAERAINNALAGDRHYDGLRASDGADISTRTKHREYMRANNLTTVDDFKGVWQKAQAERDAYRTTGKGGAVTREDIARAIHDLNR
jgi:hypothetical protein